MNLIKTITKVKQKIVIESNFKTPLKQNAFQNCFFTCTGKIDGIGAQALAVMSTQLFSYETGIGYVHTPFKEIEHNTQNIDNWVSRWEMFLNLGHGEITIKNDSPRFKSSKKVDDLSEILPSTKNRLYEVTQCHRYTNDRAYKFAELTDLFKSKYNNSSLADSRKSLFNHDKLNLTVHMRRGDVSNFSWSKKRYTSNANVINKLEVIIKILKDQRKSFRINIFSQGQLEEFKDVVSYFENEEVNLFLDTCLFSTFHSLVTSDILVMSKSTLSYSASLLSDGIIVYEDFYHKPLKTWHRYKNDKFLDYSILLDSLNKKQIHQLQ